MKKCQYSNPEISNYQCERECYPGSNFCIFHLSEKDYVDSFSKEFSDKLNKLHKNKDGDWVGFIFPTTFKLKKFDFDYNVNLSYSIFNKICITECNFRESLNLSNSMFKDDTRFHCTFEGTTNFNKCVFEARASFGGSFNRDKTTFNSCVFHDAATFLGGYDIILNMQNGEEQGNIRRLFLKETDMRDVVFYRPERVKFVAVDMSNLLLLGTDLSGVHLYDTKWFQKELNRNGLRDEVWVHKTNGKKFQDYYLPRIESQYRNVRVALEANKNFVFASDFYVSEMEIRRDRFRPLRKYFFSVEAFYNALSQYGTNPIRAAKMFFYLFLIHLLLTIYFDSFKSHLYPFEIIKYSINSLKVLTLQRFWVFIDNGIFQSFIDTFFRFAGPFQVALFAMSLRNRVKRN